MPTEFTEIPNSTRQEYNVISMNFYPIWPVINAQSNSTGQIGCKSIEIMPTKFDQAGVHSTRQAYNVISMNFHPIWPVINARLNLTSWIELGVNPLRYNVWIFPIWPLINARSNSPLRLWPQFDQAGIQCKGFRCRLISVDSHPIWPVINAQSNLTGRIGCKSIEIMTTKFDQAGIQCKGFRCWLISMNVYPIWPVINAQSNLTSQIGCKSIEIDAGWIHWDDAQFDQAGVQCNLNEKWIQSYTIHLK